MRLRGWIWLCVCCCLPAVCPCDRMSRCHRHIIVGALGSCAVLCNAQHKYAYYIYNGQRGHECISNVLSGALISGDAYELVRCAGYTRFPCSRCRCICTCVCVCTFATHIGIICVSMHVQYTIFIWMVDNRERTGRMKAHMCRSRMAIKNV